MHPIIAEYVCDENQRSPRGRVGRVESSLSAFVAVFLSATLCFSRDTTADGMGITFVKTVEGRFASLAYLRAAYDDANIAAGIHSAISLSNAREMIPSTNITLSVTTVPCHSPEACVIALADPTFFAAHVGVFINNTLPSCIAVIHPNHLLAPAVIAATRAMKRRGGLEAEFVPFVIDPNSFDSNDFAVTGNIANGDDFTPTGRTYSVSDHIVHFDPLVSHQLTHLFSFMQQDDSGGEDSDAVDNNFYEYPDGDTSDQNNDPPADSNVAIRVAKGGCAFSGVLYLKDGDVSTETAMAAALEQVRGLFSIAGMLRPAVMAYVSLSSDVGGGSSSANGPPTTDAELEDFFMVGAGKTAANRNRNRRCFVSLLEPRSLEEIVSRLMNITDGTFAAEGKVFYSTSAAAQDRYTLLPNTRVADAYKNFSPFNVNFVQWFPPYNVCWYLRDGCELWTGRSATAPHWWGSGSSGHGSPAAASVEGVPPTGLLDDLISPFLRSGSASRMSWPHASRTVASRAQSSVVWPVSRPWLKE